MLPVLFCHRGGCVRRIGGDEVGGGLCAACKTVRYCSRACQRAHWRARHRDECAERLRAFPTARLRGYLLEHNDVRLTGWRLYFSQASTRSELVDGAWLASQAWGRGVLRITLPSIDTALDTARLRQNRSAALMLYAEYVPLDRAVERRLERAGDAELLTALRTYEPVRQAVCRLIMPSEMVLTEEDQDGCSLADSIVVQNYVLDAGAPVDVALASGLHRNVWVPELHLCGNGAAKTPSLLGTSARRTVPRSAMSIVSDHRRRVVHDVLEAAGEALNMSWSKTDLDAKYYESTASRTRDTGTAVLPCCQCRSCSGITVNLQFQDYNYMCSDYEDCWQ